jgi:hypothetical protein
VNNETAELANASFVGSFFGTAETVPDKKVPRAQLKPSSETKRHLKP